MKAFICGLFGHTSRPVEGSASLCESTSWYDGVKLGVRQGVQITVCCTRCGHWTYSFVAFAEEGEEHVSG